MSKRTPSIGMKILERLYQENPNHQGIHNSLINCYIQLGIHDKAIAMITNMPDYKIDIQSLKFKAWIEHKNGNIEKEREIWDNILDICYISQVHGRIDTLILRSNRDINLKLSDIPLISVIRNEMLRLPFFLEYYRNLGVTQFIFVDNNSDDGSSDFLSKQPDCHVFWTNDSYPESGFGCTWLNNLISKYIKNNQWFLVVDADEFLVYPNCEKINLDILIKYLNKYNYEGMSSFMIDTFSKNNNTPITHNNLIKTSPYFINKYVSYYQIECPYVRPSGGLRNLLNIDAWLHVLPLMKNSSNIKLMSSKHQVTPLKISNISSAVLHFKFIGNFLQYAQNEVKRKQHASGAKHYKEYIDYINETNINNLEKKHPVVKYQNSHQLIDLGLIKCPDSWKDFIKKEIYYV